MSVIERDLRPGETIFGGGSGVILRSSMPSLKRRSASEKAESPTPNADKIEREAPDLRPARDLGPLPPSPTEEAPSE